MNGREAALQALIACRRNGAWAEGALKELLRSMDRREAALASRLCYAVLQNQYLLDYQILQYAKGKLQPVIVDILRLAVCQMEFFDKIPASAAVNEAVEQAKKHANVQAARLVNAVLRNMLRNGIPEAPVDLSIRYSHPKELVELLHSQFGEEQTIKLLQSHNTAPDTVIQTNTLKTTTELLKCSLTESNVQWQMHPWMPDSLRVIGTGSLEQLPAFQNGWFYVQDTAAKLSVLSAGIQPGNHVLDCCSAPGGKSFAAALLMQNQGKLISCDIHPHKLKLIDAGAKRLGIEILETRLQDASKQNPEWIGRMDVVIADAPCSGLGVIRKKPDIRYKDLQQTENLPAIQQAILDCQAQYVKPGGTLLYSTCTILQRENEAVAEAFLRKHPEYTLQTIHYPETSGIPSGSMTTLLPCTNDTDGFFICRFRRKQ